MGWIWQGWEEYKLALGLRRYVVINLSFAAANIVSTAYLLETGLKISPVPFISISAYYFLVILLIAISDHAIRLRRSVMPKIQLDFDEGGSSLAKISSGSFGMEKWLGRLLVFILEEK